MFKMFTYEFQLMIFNNKMEGVSILALHFKAFGYVSGGKFSRIIEIDQ